MARKKQYNTVNRQGWQRYEYKAHGGDIGYATKSELKPIIQRAAHVANERLRALERAEETKGAYRTAQRYLSMQKRNRFAEGNKIIGGMSLSKMKAMYAELRDFLSAESSTISGLSRVRKHRYETAVSRGFQGSESEWNTQVVKYFAKVQEGLFSSDTVYNALTNADGMKTDYLDDIIARDNKERSRGENGMSLNDALVEIAKIKAREKPRKRKS